MKIKYLRAENPITIIVRAIRVKASATGLNKVGEIQNIPRNLSITL